MSVYKSAKSPYWQFDFQFKRRRFYGSTGCTGRRDAERFEAEQRRLAALGPGQARQPITLDDAAGTYARDRLTGKPAGPGNEAMIEKMIAHFGAGRYLSEIAAADIAAYAARLRARVSDSTVNRYLLILRRIWRYADGTLARDTGARIDWGALTYAEPEERTRELSADEEARLFAALERQNADLAAVARFAMLCGQRVSGVIRLRWSAVDLDAGVAVFDVKGSRKVRARKHRVLLTPAMRQIIATRPKSGPFVFTYAARAARPTRKLGQGRTLPGRTIGDRYPFTTDGWRTDWAKALAAAGIEDFRFHDLRHTAATRLVRDSGNLKLAQLLLAHQDIKTTTKYAHATESDLLRAMTAAEERGGAGTSNETERKKA